MAAYRSVYSLGVSAHHFYRVRATIIVSPRFPLHYVSVPADHRRRIYFLESPLAFDSWRVQTVFSTHYREEWTMYSIRLVRIGLLAAFVGITATSTEAFAQQQTAVPGPSRRWCPRKFDRDSLGC